MSDCEGCWRQLDENVVDRGHSLILMLVSGTGPEIVDLWSSETLRVGEENREVEILSCWMSWMRGTHLYSLLSLLTLINTQPHSQCTGTDHWLHTSSSARQPIADTKNVPAAV